MRRWTDRRLLLRGGCYKHEGSSTQERPWGPGEICWGVGHRQVRGRQVSFTDNWNKNGPCTYYKIRAHVERVKRLDDGGDEDFDNDGIMNDEDEDDDNDGNE